MRTLTLCLLLLLVPSHSHAQAVTLDTSLSKITVRVYKTGLFSAFAHDHTILAPLASGSLNRASRSVRLTIRTKDMRVVDPGVSDSERIEIENTMKGSQVLDGQRFPDITFTAQNAEAMGSSAYLIFGSLTLHGVTRNLEVPVSFSAGHYTGTVKLTQSDFGITPIRIAGGTVKVKDGIEISFDLVPSQAATNQLP